MYDDKDMIFDVEGAILRRPEVVGGPDFRLILEDIGSSKGSL